MTTELIANSPTPGTQAAITTLGSGGLTSTATSMPSGTGAPPTALQSSTGQFRIVIDSEIIIASYSSGAWGTLTRGAEGSTAASHSGGASVYHDLTAGGLTAFVDQNAGLQVSGSLTSGNLLKSNGTDAEDSGIAASSAGNAIPVVQLSTVSATATVNDTNIAAALAIISAAGGGKFYVPDPNRFGQTKIKITQPVVFPKNCTVEGEVLVELWASGASGVTNTNGPGTGVTSGAGCTVQAAAFYGCVFEQQTAATDVFQFPEAASTVHMENIAGGFAAAIADTNTGHVFNATPSTDYSGKPDDGQMGSKWRNCIAFAHDGNHYGFVRCNPILGNDYHLRSYGGGGFLTYTNSALSSYGNHTSDHPYAFVYNAGTAHGFAHSASAATFPGGFGLVTYTRPQAIAHNAVKTAATQGAWNDNALATGFDPAGITAISPDLENFAANSNQYVSPNTVFSGHGLISIAYGPYSDYLFNVALGYQALGKVTTNSGNTAIGYQASAANVNQSGATAVGYQALNVSTAASNTAVGYQAMAATTTSSTGTAVGYQALAAQTNAQSNTAVGYKALATTTTSGQNTAVGYQALMNVTSTHNAAVGNQAMQTATTASGDVAIGDSALFAVTTAAACVAIGQNAGYKPAGTVANATVAGNYNTFVGYQTGVNSTGDYAHTTALGYQALVNGGYATALGNGTIAGAAGTVAIGCDHTGSAASTTTQDVIALGTANHQVQIKNNTTGAGSAALGANCPAVTATAPYTWMKLMSSDGSTVYVPAWK